MKKTLTWIGIIIVALVVVGLIWSWLRPKTPPINDVFTPPVDNWTPPEQPPCPSGDCKG